MLDLNFTAIDFETATYKGESICQIGLVKVEDGKVVDEINQLILPPDNVYSIQNIQVHGITPERTVNAPTFEEYWGKMKSYIEYEKVVAHNAVFDISCLKKTLQYYDLAIPKFKQACTYRIYKKGLAELCDMYHIKLNHHDALSDARACATLYLKHILKRDEEKYKHSLFGDGF